MKCHTLVCSAAVSLVSVALVLMVGCAAASQGIEDEERAIARELQCPVCENLAVADSPSQLAGQMRAVIRQKLDAGESRNDILRYFADRYGEGILLSPPRSGFTLLVWTAPYLGLAAAVGFLVWAVRRRRPSSDVDDLDALSPQSSPNASRERGSESAQRTVLGAQSDLDAYLSEVDATVDRLRDEPVR